MKENTSLKKEINHSLEKEGLKYEGSIEITHFLYVLYSFVGLETIKEKIARAYRGLKIATHYGCHALRPSDIVRFDDPLAPTLFDELVQITGAESIHWPAKLECCGAPALGVNDVLSMDLTRNKLKDAKQSGADYLCAACPYCHIQFDTIQKRIFSEQEENHYVPCVLYSQLLGLSLGIDGQTLGLGMNQIDIRAIEDFLLSK